MDGNYKSASKRKLDAPLPDVAQPIAPIKGLDKQEPVKYNLFETHGTVAVRCAFPANVYRTGQVTGKQYYWAGAGSVIEVDERDVEQLLSLVYGTPSCCGNSGGAFHYFELI